MTPEELRARSYAAQALLNDETLKQGWSQIEGDLIAEWLKPSGYHDERAQANRERIWMEIQVMRNLRQKLAGFAGQSRE